MQNSISTHASTRLAGLTVLVVDDDEDDLETLVSALESLGCHAVAAHTAEESMGLIPKTRPQLILSDIRLPGMSGTEMFRRIRKDETIPSIPMMAVTAFPESLESTFNAGALAYILKPVQIDALAERMEAILDRGKKEPPGTLGSLRSLLRRLLSWIPNLFGR